MDIAQPRPTSVLDGLPRRVLLISVGTDDRRVGVHDLADRAGRCGCEEAFNGREPDEAIADADGHDAGAV